MNWNKTKKTIENIIFSSQRLLIPFYFGLFVALIIYTIVYLHEIYNFVSTFQSYKKSKIKRDKKPLRRENNIFNCFFSEIFFLPYKQCDYTCRNGCIGQIKYWAEEFKILASPYRNPGRKMSIRNDGEIKHIHHFAVQESSISAAIRKKRCHILQVRAAFIKDKAIEHTVEKVA